MHSCVANMATGCGAGTTANCEKALREPATPSVSPTLRASEEVKLGMTEILLVTLLKALMGSNAT